VEADRVRGKTSRGGDRRDTERCLRRPQDGQDAFTTALAGRRGGGTHPAMFSPFDW